MPNSHRILLVDDDRASRDALFVFLGAAGYSVLTADNGRQALDLLEHGIRPRLVILDLRLPQISGWDVLEHIRSDVAMRQIPVIVCTATPAQDGLIRRRITADAILQKPISLDELLSTMVRIVGPGAIVNPV